MGVYNNIALNCKCPFCGEEIDLQVQTKVCTSADGDERGRFCMRTYRIGEEMLWWDNSDHRFQKWRHYNDGEYSYKNTISNIEVEPCLGSCLKCNGDLYAVVEFELNRPKQVLEIGKEDDLDWGKWYP